MGKVTVLLSCALLLGCTTLGSRALPETQYYFVLDKDQVVTTNRGLFQIRWVEGLTAGKYVSVMEDSDGTYFRGEGACVLILRDDWAEEYLKTGKANSAWENDYRAWPIPANAGGLWLPKPGVSKSPMLFFVNRNTTSGASMGLTGMAIVVMTEGNVQFWSTEAGQAIAATIKPEHYLPPPQ
jgi:hypothetical protein